MTRKHNAVEGTFASAGKAVDESVAMAAAVRAGKLTRAQFDAWYAKRTGEGEDIVVSLREKTSRLWKPVETAVESALAKGREVLRAEPVAVRARRRRSAGRK